MTKDKMSWQTLVVVAAGGGKDNSAKQRKSWRTISQQKPKAHLWGAGTTVIEGKLVAPHLKTLYISRK